MSILNKASEVSVSSGNGGTALKDLYVKVDKNSSLKIVPLVSFEDVLVYRQFNFGAGSNYFTVIDDNEPKHPCSLMGETSKAKYIMPVVVYQEDTKTWSEPLYYTFPSSVYQGFSMANVAIMDKREESENNSFTFKGAIITIHRNDETANGFVEYTVQWIGDVWGSTKNTKGLELPENTLDMELGVMGFKANSPEEIREKIMQKLIEKSDFKVKSGKTIGEALKEIKTDDEWDNLTEE